MGVDCITHTTKVTLFLFFCTSEKPSKTYFISYFVSYVRKWQRTSDNMPSGFSAKNIKSIRLSWCVHTHTTVTFNTLLKPSCVCLALCRPPGALFTTPPHTVASLDTTAAPPDPLAVIVGGNSGLKAALTARQQGDEDDGGGCGAGAVGGDGARDRAQWMTNTTRRPGTGTCRR